MSSKQASVFAPKKVIRVNALYPDQSIDLENSKIQEYTANRKEENLVFIDGMKPDYFFIEKLSFLPLLSVKNAAKSLSMSCCAAFCLGVKRIETSDGQVLEPSETMDMAYQGASFKSAKNSWLQEVSDLYGYDTVMEMGQLVLEYSSLGKEQKSPFFCWVGTVQKS